MPLKATPEPDGSSGVAFVLARDPAKIYPYDKSRRSYLNCFGIFSERHIRNAQTQKPVHS